MSYHDEISTSSHPEQARLRLQHLLKDKYFSHYFSELDTGNKQSIVHILGLSDFFFRLFCYKPEIIQVLHETPDLSLDSLTDINQVKKYKYSHLLKATEMDLALSVNYENILNYLSDIADVSIKSVLSLVLNDDHETSPFSVIAMGKLGARELNFSSDVDLMFTCQDEDNKKKEPLQRLIRKFVSLLQETNANGFLYRVDLNLRPWSKTGPVIMSVEQLENYYAMSNEPMERFIWLRARVNAGNPNAGHELIQRLKPFVYKGFMSSEDLDRFLEIKNEIKKMHRKDGAWNVKMGQGGIRDIEFYIQILQISNASNNEGLQKTNTLDVIRELVATNIINKKRAEQIYESYLFLRRLENHLQMIDEKQTHHLPEDPAQRLKIARSMGFIEGDDKNCIKQFESCLSQHRELSATCFEDILPGKKYKAVKKSVPEQFAHTWDTKLANSSFQRWQEVCKKEKWTYDEQLDYLIIAIFGSSWYFTRFIFYRGDKIIPVLENRHCNFERNQFEKLFSSIDSDLETELQFEQLRIQKNEIMLRILLFSMASKLDQEEMEKALSNLAECTFDKALEIYFPDKQDYEDIVVMAMGRMAGHEMTFGSDLDLIFLSFGQLDDRFYQTGKKIMACMRKISCPSPEGMLYEVDTRLRPHGNSGTLITRFQAFERHHLENREVWEKQIMTRCRIIFGDRERLLQAGFDNILDSLYQIEDRAGLAREIVDMRMMVEEKLGSPVGKYDVKKGRGGIMDIDFIGHFTQLNHGRDEVGLRTNGTRQAIRIAYEKTYLDNKQSTELLENYNFLKKLETRLRVFDLKTVDVIDKDPDKNQVLARAMGFGIAGDERNVLDFMNEYRQRADSVRTAFNKILNVK